MKQNKIRKIIAIIYRSMKFTFFEEIKRELFPPRLPKNKNAKVCIHLGCGSINSPEFINVDIMPYSHVHYIKEIEDLNIFPDEYADLLYASHVLEHISYNDLKKVLTQWYRALKREGILRISVPDIDKLIDIYRAEGKDIKSIIGPLLGGQDSAYNFHKSVFSEKYIKELLYSAKFKNVRLWDPNKEELHSFEDWANRSIEVNKKKYSISLNIEAVK